MALNSLVSRPTKAGLLRKKTKRGCRAGRKRTKFTIKRTQSDLRHFKSSGGQKLNTNQAYLPKVFYTNCRSLNQWKLDELKVLTEINKPNVICLTETWLDNNKQSTAGIDGYCSGETEPPSIILVLAVWALVLPQDFSILFGGF